MRVSLDRVSLAGRTGPRLADVSCTLDPAIPTVVIGPNGAGKSSLIRVIAGLERPDAGRVLLDDAPLQTRSRADRAAALAWLPQHPRPEEGLTAVEAVAAARVRHRESWSEALHAARTALDGLSVGTLADRPMQTLSGGEAQRVRLASLAAQEAAWWLLDEPANHLDPAVRLDLLQVVRHRVADGGGVLLVTHDLTLLPHLPGARVLGLHEGQLAVDAPADDPDLPDRLGALLGLHLIVAPTPRGPRWVVVGVR